MTLRIVIYTQIAWIALLGGICRGVLQIPEAIPNMLPFWCNTLLGFVVACSWCVFPVLVFHDLSRKHLPAAKVVVIVGIEVGLTFAYFIAMLPAIQ